MGAVELGPNGRPYLKITVKGLFGAKDKILIAKEYIDPFTGEPVKRNK